MRDSRGTLGKICDKLGIETTDSLARISWNGGELEQVYPWGTIRIPTPEANLQTARELSQKQVEEIRLRARPYLETFDYKSFT